MPSETKKSGAHTPGPWKVRSDAPHVRLIRYEPEHLTVAVLQDEANPGEEALATLCADACLIAAAPTMLDLLVEAAARKGLPCAGSVRGMGSTPCDCFPCDWSRRARAVIARAEGSA